jgi:hypothetical protein
MPYDPALKGLGLEKRLCYVFNSIPDQTWELLLNGYP